MPIQHALWKVGSQPTPLSLGKLASEQALEDMIVREPGILSAEWMLIGRQEQTGFGGRIDLLAIAPDGSLVLIELKRNRTSREIVAQALDYAAWVEKLTADRIAQIYQRFSNGGSLDEAFEKRFGAKLDEETLNESHQIVLVAAELDDATERIIQYLNDRDIAINVLFFQVFQHGSDLLLSRAWLLEASEVFVGDNGSSRQGQKGSGSRQWDEVTYLAELEKKGGKSLLDVARRLLAWSRSNSTRIWWGRGTQSGSFVPVLEDGPKCYLFAAQTRPSQSRPAIQLYFSHWAKHPPFDSRDSRLELLRKLNLIRGISLPETAVDRWPSIPMDALANPGALDQFLETMNLLISSRRNHLEGAERPD